VIDADEGNETQESRSGRGHYKLFSDARS